MSAGTHGRTQTPAHARLEPGAERCKKRRHDRKITPPPRPALTRSLSYCTLALTEAAPVRVNVHVFVLLPPLEQAPDQITSRVLEALSVIEVPVVNVAEPLAPRSEERRVGKECRSRWWPAHEQKKRQASTMRERESSR